MANDFDPIFLFLITFMVGTLFGAYCMGTILLRHNEKYFDRSKK